MTETTTDELTENEREVLSLFEGHGIMLGVGEVTRNTELSDSEAQAAVEALEHHGYLESHPVTYELARGSDA